MDTDQEHTPGWKYYYWEMKGVPTRIEVGRKELDASTVTIARRDKREKHVVRLEEAVDLLRKIWSEINEYLRSRALEHLARKTVFLPEHPENKGFDGLVIAP